MNIEIRAGVGVADLIPQKHVAWPQLQIHTRSVEAVLVQKWWCLECLPTCFWLWWCDCRGGFVNQRWKTQARVAASLAQVPPAVTLSLWETGETPSCLDTFPVVHRGCLTQAEPMFLRVFCFSLSLSTGETASDASAEMLEMGGDESSEESDQGPVFMLEDAQDSDGSPQGGSVQGETALDEEVAEEEGPTPGAAAAAADPA